MAVAKSKRKGAQEKVDLSAPIGDVPPIMSSVENELVCATDPLAGFDLPSNALFPLDSVPSPTLIGKSIGGSESHLSARTKKALQQQKGLKVELEADAQLKGAAKDQEEQGRREVLSNIRKQRAARIAAENTRVLSNHYQGVNEYLMERDRSIHIIDERRHAERMQAERIAEQNRLRNKR